MPILTSNETGEFSGGLGKFCFGKEAKIRFYDPSGVYASEYYQNNPDDFSFGNVIDLVVNDNGSSDGQLGDIFLSRNSPVEAINNMVDKITSLLLPEYSENLLVVSLDKVTDMLEDNNPNNDKSACGILTAFIQKLDGLLKSNELTIDERDSLASDAEAIQNSLDCK